MKLAECIAKRYSQRYFDKTRPVPDELLSEILDAARLAPTAHNQQPFHIYKLTGAGMAGALKDVTRGHFGAPLVLALTINETESWKRSDGYDNASIDAGIVGTHIILTAESLGLGCCWVGSFDPEPLSRLLPLSEDEQPVALFPLGYPAEHAKPGPLHEKRKSIDDLLTEVALIDEA